MSETKDTRLLRILKNLDALGCTLIAKRAKVGEYICVFCKYSYTSEVRQKFDGESI